VVNTLNKFKPVTYEKYEWAIFKDVPHYLGVVSFIIVCLIIDCNNFFLKSLYWIPPVHEIMKFRIFMWGFAAIATAKEWNAYISDEHSNKLGAFAWMTFYTCGIETLSIIKGGIAEGIFDFSVFPWFVYLIWIVFGVLFITGLVFSISNGMKQEKKNKFNPYNPVTEVFSHAKKNQ
jgi:hypothetical protein